MDLCESFCRHLGEWNFLYLYFAFSFKRSSSIWQMYKQLPGFQRLTASVHGLVEEILCLSKCCSSGISWFKFKYLWNRASCILSKTNVRGFKDWPLEQSHFNRILSIFFLLGTVCFRIAALGTVLGKILNGVMVLLYKIQIFLFYFFLATG